MRTYSVGHSHSWDFRRQSHLQGLAVLVVSKAARHPAGVGGEGGDLRTKKTVIFRKAANFSRGVVCQRLRDLQSTRQPLRGQSNPETRFFFSAGVRFWVA
jgi:hypothetical protein